MQRSTKLKSIAMACLLMASSEAMAQNDARFHMELDYGYQLGISEALHSYDYHATSGMSGHALTINALYNIRPDMTVGAGFGLNRYTTKGNGGVNTMPLYATFRYRPLATHRGAYIYTDAGYGLLSKKEGSTFAAGFLGGIGVGYQLMLRRHFGLNFKLGYDLHQFKQTKVFLHSSTHSDEQGQHSTTQWSYDEASLWRHSVLFGFGLVF